MITIPFLKYFRWKVKEQPVSVCLPASDRPVEKPSSERLSKTVLPTSRRVAAAPDPFQTGPSSLPAVSASSSNGSSAAAPRTVSFGGPGVAMRTANLPPALALALEPKVERVISLELGEILSQMTPGQVKELSEEDASRRVLLKAAELERGMAQGKPSVSLASIYRQVPEVFLNPVDASDNSEVRLPFGKVLEQFTNLQQRSDQYRERTVPQVETPFLKVTLEDDDRFGTMSAPLEGGDLPTVRLEPATADSIAAAEPEPAAQEQTASLPKRIAFKLSPGTDVSASEGVPASNGASVPTSLPPPPAPTRIPFKMSAPSEDVRPKEEPWLTKESFAIEENTPVAPVDEAIAANEATNAPDEGTALMISLPLKSILKNLPPFQLTADISDVPEGTRIELPFALVEPQLASGRVAVKPNEFAAALPEEYRVLFTAKDIAAPVSLPLQDVWKNLPVPALRMRDNQEEQEKGANFETPFSAKADEDARRFHVSGTPVAKPASVEPPAAVSESSTPAAARVTQVSQPEQPFVAARTIPFSIGLAAKEAPAAGRNVLQKIFETDEELDAKSVVAHVSKMPGVKACQIMFGDGLSLAGNFPEELDADGLCALAPPMLERIDHHLLESGVGELRAMTLTCANATLTFLMQKNLCLAALHRDGELTAESRERLGRVVQELSEKYSNPL